MDAGVWLRELRERHGLSQARLAFRARTSQQALSKIEDGTVSPSVGTLARLAGAAGEELLLHSRERQVPFEDAQLAASAGTPIEERLELAISWNKLAGEITAAGQQARGDA